MPHLMEKSLLKYNTEQELLLFREYGRNIHKLVKYALTVENQKERTAVAKAVVNLMAQLHPNLKNVEEFKHKLWDQLHAIADFKLDIDSPYPVPENYEQVMQKRAHVPYPKSKIRLRHYGKNIETLVEKAVATEDLRKKAELIRIIVYYMNLVHRNWNKESNMNEDIIKTDLKTLSKGALDSDWAEQYIVDRGGTRQVILQVSNNNNQYKQNQHGNGAVLVRRKKRKGSSRKKK